MDDENSDLLAAASEIQRSEYALFSFRNDDDGGDCL